VIRAPSKFLVVSLVGGTNHSRCCILAREFGRLQPVRALTLPSTTPQIPQSATLPKSSTLRFIRSLCVYIRSSDAMKQIHPSVTRFFHSLCRLCEHQRRCDDRWEEPDVDDSRRGELPRGSKRSPLQRHFRWLPWESGEGGGGGSLIIVMFARSAVQRADLNCRRG
jgi:hypothetical protein